MTNRKSLLFKFLPVAFVILLLFLPSIADGFALDLAIMQLEAVSEKTSPIMAVLVGVFIFFAVGVALLWISTGLLQAAIDGSSEALTVMGGDAAEVVQVGWNFTVGIGNMLLLIAFIVIALSTILGYENFKFQKLLPRLVGVALLMNFTLLFVGAGIDVSNFLFNSIATTFSEEGGNILWEAIDPLLNLGTNLLLSTIGILAAFAISMLVPYVNVLAQIAWIVGFAVLLPFLLQLLISGGIALIMAGVFFIYFVVFIARIFVIQILAIIAPLAFFCLIFDETKQYWQLWLQHLVQWLMVGVAFIFFMSIGLTLAPLVGDIMRVADTDGFPKWLQWFLESNLVSHIILLIYFVILMGVIKKFIPAAASAVISQTASVVKSASPYVGAIGRGGKKRYQSQLSESDKMQNKMGQWTTETHTPTGNKLKDAFGNMKSRGKRAIGGALGPGVKDAERKETEKEAEKLKGKSPELMAKTYLDAASAPKGDPTANRKKTAAVLAAQEEGKVGDLRPHISSNLSKDYGDIYKKAESIGEGKKIRQALPVEHLTSKNRGLSKKEQEKNTTEFMQKDLKGKDMEGSAQQIVDAIKSGNIQEREQGKLLIKAMSASQDTSYLHNFFKGAKGAEGVQQFNIHIDEESVKKGRKAGLAKDRKKTIEEINPELKKDIDKSPGKVPLNA